MSDHRSLARAAVALSAVAVAVCAITLTIHVMASGIAVTRVLDQEALERQVAEHATGKSNRDGVKCPVAVEAKEGNKFTCEIDDVSDEKVGVTVTSDQGELAMGYAP